MRIYYKSIGDSQPTFITDESSTAIRPDEKSFLSNIPKEKRVDIYTLSWDGNAPSISRNASADSLIAFKALKMVSAEIDEQNRKENRKNFTYNGKEFYSDRSAIESVRVMSLSLSPTDPVPSPGNVWKTAEREADGVTSITVPMTVAEFMIFSKAYFDRGKENHRTKEFHKKAIQVLYLDGDKDGILNYDYSTGWQ
jgi:hypothetical protein